MAHAGWIECVVGLLAILRFLWSAKEMKDSLAFLAVLIPMAVFRSVLDFCTEEEEELKALLDDTKSALGLYLWFFVFVAGCLANWAVARLYRCLVNWRVQYLPACPTETPDSFAKNLPASALVTELIDVFRLIPGGFPVALTSCSLANIRQLLHDKDDEIRKLKTDLAAEDEELADLLVAKDNEIDRLVADVKTKEEQLARAPTALGRPSIRTLLFPDSAYDPPLPRSGPYSVHTGPSLPRFGSPVPPIFRPVAKLVKPSPAAVSPSPVAVPAPPSPAATISEKERKEAADTIAQLRCQQSQTESLHHDKITRLEAELATATADLAATIQEKRSYGAIIATQHNKNADLEAKLHAKVAEQAEHVNQANATVTANAQSETKIAELESQLSELRQMMATASEQFDARLNEQAIRAHAMLVSQFEAKIVSLEGEVSRSKQELDGACEQAVEACKRQSATVHDQVLKKALQECRLEARQESRELHRAKITERANWVSDTDHMAVKAENQRLVQEIARLSDGNTDTTDLRQKLAKSEQGHQEVLQDLAGMVRELDEIKQSALTLDFNAQAEASELKDKLSRAETELQGHRERQAGSFDAKKEAIERSRWQGKYFKLETEYGTLKTQLANAERAAKQPVRHAGQVFIPKTNLVKELKESKEEAVRLSALNVARLKAVMELLNWQHEGDRGEIETEERLSQVEEELGDQLRPLLASIRWSNMNRRAEMGRLQGQLVMAETAHQVASDAFGARSEVDKRKETQDRDMRTSPSKRRQE